MQRAMAAQAEAERVRRAKIIGADGEFQAAQRLADAGEIMSQHPATLQLRFLQTLSEVATERNSTIVFPVPIDLIQAFMPPRDGVPLTSGGGQPSGEGTRQSTSQPPSPLPPSAQPPLSS
jgi:hypothetical protein